MPLFDVQVIVRFCATYIGLNRRILIKSSPRYKSAISRIQKYLVCPSDLDLIQVPKPRPEAHKVWKRYKTGLGTIPVAAVNTNSVRIATSGLLSQEKAPPPPPPLLEILVPTSTLILSIRCLYTLHVFIVFFRSLYYHWLASFYVFRLSVDVRIYWSQAYFLLSA